MAKLTELNNTTHSNLKVIENCVMKVAKSQHIIDLKITEAGMAASNFPVFLTRLPQSGDWALSGVASLEPNQNLFVVDEQWQATYTPVTMQTYPFFLMVSPKDEKQFTVGFDEQNPYFSDTEGEALFDEKGQASLQLSRVTALLEDNIKNDIHTHRFLNKLQELGLIRAINVLVHYEEGKVNTLKGLNSIDEEKLAALDDEKFNELRTLGYLVPIYAILISIYQLNTLVRKHNLVDGTSSIKQVSMEVAKDNDIV